MFEDNSDAKINFGVSKDLLFILRRGILVGGSFALLYTLPNHLGHLRDEVYRIYFDWELTIPKVPIFIIIYMSAYLHIFSPLFILTKKEINIYVKGLLLMTFVAGFFFLAFPSAGGFSRSLDMDYLRFAFEWLYMADKNYNLFPSLHVAYSTYTSYILWRYIQNKVFHFVLATWQVALYFSVVLTHQHHLFDIVTGIVLSICVMKVFLPQKSR